MLQHKVSLITFASAAIGLQQPAKGLVVCAADASADPLGAHGLLSGQHVFIPGLRCFAVERAGALAAVRRSKCAVHAVFCPKHDSAWDGTEPGCRERRGIDVAREQRVQAWVQLSAGRVDNICIFDMNVSENFSVP